MALGAALPAAPGADVCNTTTIIDASITTMNDDGQIKDDMTVDTKEMMKEDYSGDEEGIDDMTEENKMITMTIEESLDMMNITNIDDKMDMKEETMDTNSTKKIKTTTKDEDDIAANDEEEDGSNGHLDVMKDDGITDNSTKKKTMTIEESMDMMNMLDMMTTDTIKKDHDTDDQKTTTKDGTAWVPLNKRTISRKDRRHIRENERMMNNNNTISDTANNTISDAANNIADIPETTTRTVEEDNASIQAIWMRTKQRMSKNDDSFNKIAMEEEQIAMEQEQIAMEQEQIAMEQEGIRHDISDLANMIEILEQEIHQRVLDQQCQLEMHRQHQLDLEVTEYYRLERYRQDQLGLEMNRQCHLEIPMGDAWTYDCSIMAASTQLEIPLGNAWIQDSIITTTTQPLKWEPQPQEHKANNMCKETREKLPSTPPRSTKPTQISPKTPFEELSMLRQQYQISPPVFNPRQPPSFITELQLVTSSRQTQKDKFKAVHTALQYALAYKMMTVQSH